MHTIVVLLNVVLMLAVLWATLYAQIRLPHHSASPRQALFSRLMLIVVGLAAGWTAMRYAAEEGAAMQVIGFLTGFGLVHVPAAFILYSKKLRGVSR